MLHFCQFQLGLILKHWPILASVATKVPTSWQADSISDCCTTFEGITCAGDNTTQRITGMYESPPLCRNWPLFSLICRLVSTLSTSSVKMASLPSSITSLTELRSFEINKITGEAGILRSLPQGFWLLPKLQLVDIAGSFLDQIPTSISPSLTSLCV